MKAVNDKLIIIPDEPKTMTDGGLYIPEQAQEPPVSGIVKYSANTEKYPIGSKVYYPNYVVVPFDKFHIIPAEEVFAVEEGND